MYLMQSITPINGEYSGIVFQEVPAPVLDIEQQYQVSTALIEYDIYKRSITALDQAIKSGTGTELKNLSNPTRLFGGRSFVGIFTSSEMNPEPRLQVRQYRGTRLAHIIYDTVVVSLDKITDSDEHFTVVMQREYLGDVRSQQSPMLHEMPVSRYKALKLAKLVTQLAEKLAKL